MLTVNEFAKAFRLSVSGAEFTEGRYHRGM